MAARRVWFAAAAALVLLAFAAQVQAQLRVTANGTLEVVNPLHTSNPRIDIEFQVFNGTGWRDADSVPGCPQLLNTTNGRVQYRIAITNTGGTDLTNIVIIALGQRSSITFLAKGKSWKWEPSPVRWAAGQSSRTANVTAKYKTTNVSRSDQAHYLGLAPGLQMQLQVRDDTGAWRNADSPSSSPLLSQELARLRRNNSVSLRLQLNNTGNMDLVNLALGGNWRGTGSASSGTVQRLAVGQVMNLEFNTPYQLLPPQNRTATVIVRPTDGGRNVTLQVSNSVFWRVAQLLKVSLDIDSNFANMRRRSLLQGNYVAADTDTTALPIPMQYVEEVRFRAMAQNTGTSAVYVRLNAGTGASKAETVQPGGTLTLTFARNYECANLGDILAATVNATTTYNGVTITTTNPAYFTFYANIKNSTLTQDPQ